MLVFFRISALDLEFAICYLLFAIYLDLVIWILVLCIPFKFCIYLFHAELFTFIQIAEVEELMPGVAISTVPRPAGRGKEGEVRLRALFPYLSGYLKCSYYGCTYRPVYQS